MFYLIWLRRKSKKLIDKIEISKIVFLIFHESLFQKNKNLYFCKDIVQDYSTVSTILFYLIWLQIKSKKLIDKIEISKIVFLIFHERLFQKNKNLYFCKDIVQDYSKVFTILFYLIWLQIKSKKLIDKIEISKIVFLIFHERLFQKNKNLYFCKDIVQDYSTVSTILFYLIWLQIKSKKLIDKIEISKIVFLIFHERLFQKNKNLYFCKDIVQDYSKVFTILFYLIWLRRKSKKLIDKIEISKIVFLIFHESLFQKNKNLYFCKDIVQDYSKVFTILFYLISLRIKSKKLIDKIEISKIVFLIFHERLFQKNKNLYFCKDIGQDYSTVSTILFYLIWLRRKSKKLIDKMEISKIVFLIFHESLFQKNKCLYI